jgi:phage anti-repressor protein
MENSKSNLNEIKTTIAMFRSFVPGKPIKDAVIYFWESHTKNPEDKNNIQATSNLIYKIFDMPSCEKYEVRTGYLSRYNYMLKDMDKLTPEEIQESIRKGKEEQDSWLKRCEPYLPGFIQKDWTECISKENNKYYEECKDLVCSELKKSEIFQEAFSKSVESYVKRHQSNHYNGKLYILEEISWILNLPLVHLNKHIYLIHVGNDNSAVKTMFNIFPHLGKAVKWVSPRLRKASFKNTADFLLHYNVNNYAGYSYAIKNVDIAKDVAIFIKNTSTKKVSPLLIAADSAAESMLDHII